MPRSFAAVLFVSLSFSAACAQSRSAQDKAVHLNQIQVIGTHNSYNMGFAPSEGKYVQEHYARTFHGVDYHHQTLTQQLDGGARQLELDIVQDPKGGRFAHPKIVELTKEAGLPADPDFDPDHDMDKPGFKTIHLGDLNQRSSCHLFVKCLQAIRTWSHAHKGHVPIFMLIEDKQGRLSQLPGATTAEPWTAATWDAMDAEIRSVFPEKEIITPDKVRGSYPTLEAAVLAGRWPTLRESRGKVVFLLYNRKSGAPYLEGHPMMKGRVLFVNGRPGEPEAGFVEQDQGTAAQIDALVKKGYLVRSRSDYNTDQGRNNDTTRRDELLGSGAQMISTDFPVSEPAPWTGYTVGLPGGYTARCNPVNAPAGCDSALIEPGTRTKEPSPSHKPEHAAAAPLPPPAGQPKVYEVSRATGPVEIDGKLDDAAWNNAAWTDDFVDIEGAIRPRPRFRTRAKMLWDDHYLYIGAELEESEVKASITRHDAVIFHDNDFEVFLKPLPNQDGYFEFEMNALNTGWDLYLNKPYRMGGKADNSWEMEGMKSAVAIQGTLNDETDKDRSWTLEIAIPWTAFASRQQVPAPVAGTEWRINFSRVEWKTGQPKEDNWVWSPQGVINMHVPERWGYLRFR